MNTQSQLYKQLEAIPDPVSIPQSNWQKITEKLKTIGHQIWQYLTTKPELKIWQCKDRDGNIWWYIYDPTTERTGCFASEEEVLMWIEESFYIRNTPNTCQNDRLNFYQQRLFW